MRFLKYFLYSDVLVRIGINPFNPNNWVMPNIAYQGPAGFDKCHRTVALILPFIEIFFDFDCMSIADKQAEFEVWRKKAYDALDGYNSIFEKEEFDVK